MSDSPAMISAPRLCPKCGSEIPADAPERGCPGCLLENGLGLLPDALVAARDASTVISPKANECGSAEDFEVNTAGPAGNSEKAKRSAEALGKLGDYELLEVVGRGGQGGLPGASEESQSHSGTQDD